MNITFSEFQPSSDLVPFIQSYWAGDFNGSGQKDFRQSVVPNGSIELIVHLSDDLCSLVSSDGNWRESPPFTLIGLYTKSYEVRFSSRVQVFGIRFHPDGFRNVFGISPVEFSSAYENGGYVLGNGFREFCLRVREMQLQNERVQTANHYFRGQLDQNRQPFDYTHLAMRLVRSAARHETYADLVRHVPISERQLQRSLRQQYGITLTDYLRLARMNATYRYLQARGEQPLTQVGGDLDFFDQSHFIREFKSHVGMSPGKFLRQRDRFIVNPVLPDDPCRNS